MRFFLICFLISSTALAEPVFRDPVEFLRKHLIDFSFGPGYTIKENIRLHNKKTTRGTGTNESVFPLYDLRIGPVNITSIYSQPNFTRGKGPRLGFLFAYTGDPYEADTVAARNDTLFGGGFVGYGYTTFYTYTDLLKKGAGSLYALRFAPLIAQFGRGEVFLVFEGQLMNRPYVHYYFGVREDEGSARIPAYRGERTINYSGNLLFVYTFSKVTSFLLWGGEKRYGSGVFNSPTVGLKHEYSAGAGLLFKIM